MRHSRKRVALNITDGKTALAIWRMSRYLHQAAIGRWFRSNYHHLLLGVALSFGAVCLTAAPRSIEHWGVLLLGLAAMAPGGYYGFFVLLRISDLIRAVREHMAALLVGQLAVLLGLLLPCLAAFVLGGVVLGESLGFPVLVLTACLVTINVASLLWLRFPTAKGRRLFTEIEGFRQFLLSVERLPKDGLEAPSDHIGLYEKYLPYAVALEVEQAWCDQFVAFRSAFREQEFIPGVRPFYLGMWDGKPVEIVYKPTSGVRSY